MSDTPERQGEYKPEEGAEVRPTSRYSVVSPPSYMALGRDVAETAYQTLSVLAMVALGFAAVYSFLIAIGGIAAFWTNARWVVIAGTIVVPLLSLPVGQKFNIQGAAGLSRFAVVALVSFYAVPIGIGGLIAFPNSSPWLLPMWTLVFPLVAIVLGLAARLRIQASEGTLSGKALTSLAIGLSIFFALCYTAFYFATYFAVRQQGLQFAGEWIDKAQQGDVERAFVMTVPPQFRGTSDSLSREYLELVYNSRTGPDKQGEGEYSSFIRKPYVWLLRGSSKQNVEFVAVHDWGYESGGYKVVLNYQVSTPYWSFPMELTVIGMESSKNEYKGRRWYVQKEDLGTKNPQPVFTPDGLQLMTLMDAGQKFASDWTRALWNDDLRVVEATLPPGERGKGLPPGSESTAAALGLGLRAWEVQAPFFRGELVRSDDKKFWTPENAPPRMRELIISYVKKMFAHKGDKPQRLEFRESKRIPAPDWGEEDGKLFFRYDVDLEFMKVPFELPTQDGQLVIQPVDILVEGQFVLSCQKEAMQTGKPEWRIESFDLVRSRGAEQKKPPGR